MVDLSIVMEQFTNEFFFSNNYGMDSIDDKIIPWKNPIDWCEYYPLGSFHMTKPQNTI